MAVPPILVIDLGDWSLEGDECRLVLPPGLRVVIDPAQDEPQAITIPMEVLAPKHDFVARRIVRPWRAAKRRRSAGD